MYTIRSEGGILIARVTNKDGKALILESKGHFDTNNLKNYVFESDMTFIPIQDSWAENPYYTKLYIWAGYYIYED